MKHLPLPIVLFFLTARLVVGQTPETTSFHQADSLAALDHNAASVEELATLLTAGLDSELEKARAFFMWLAQNVRYDCRKFHNPVRPQFTARTEAELEQKMIDWRQEQLQKALDRKRGVCEDYSRLFKAMCDASGVECVMVTGYARDFYKPRSNPRDNRHAWNAIRIDDEWHLLDATWAAGHVNPGVTRFTQNLKPGYFMPPPEWLLQSHFPEDPQWQLVDAPLDKNAFTDQPLVNFGQSDFPLTDFALSAQVVNGQKQVWFQFEKAPKYFNVLTPSGKPVKFEHFEKDGRTIIGINSSRVSRINIYARDSMRSRGSWLAMYIL